VVLLATLAARRFGHRVSGVLSGMPMVAGPIMGFLLLQQTPETARDIALATLVCLPAMVAHMVTFAHAARRWTWPIGLLLANGVFVSIGWVLATVSLPPVAACVFAAVAPWLGLRAMPRATVSASPVGIPSIELVLRIAAAVALAAAIMLGAPVLPVAISGLLLAAPITGNVLPCFTLPRHGADATIALLRGFVHGLFGFVCLFVVLVAALPAWGPGLAYAAAWIAAVGLAMAMNRLAFRRADLTETRTTVERS
jgi:hypothetical protein